MRSTSCGVIWRLGSETGDRQQPFLQDEHEEAAPARKGGQRATEADSQPAHQKRYSLLGLITLDAWRTGDRCFC